MRLDASVIPAPRPFSPFSSSSNKRKFRGTLAPMFADVRRAAEGKCARKWDVRSPAIEQAGDCAGCDRERWIVAWESFC